MAKKLFIVWLSLTMITFSSISIYANEHVSGDYFIPKAPLPLTDEQTNSRTKTVMKTVAIKETVAEEKAAAEQKAADEKKAAEEKYARGLAAYIRSVNYNVEKKEARDMAEDFVKYAKRYKVDETIVMAIAQNESCYYSDVVSSEDFKGLMQTGDGLARNAGYEPQDLFDPEISIKVGARYFGIKLKEFGDTRLALTAYNQGSGSVHSGNYTTGYADLAMSRAQDIEKFLEKKGFVKE